MPLDTLANVKITLGIAAEEDDRLVPLANAAEAFIRDWCGRDFFGGTFTEFHPADRRTVCLQHWPVTSVSSVRVDPAGVFPASAELSIDAYRLDGGRGILEAVAGRFGPTGNRGGRALRITYTTPTGAVPAAVQRAYAELIGHWYRLEKTHTALGQKMQTQATSGTTSATYPWGVSGGFRLPHGIRELLAPYREPTC
ncbi:MAG: hypothetical protein ACRCZF_08255 [Gemmataceae bacterium]